MYTVHDKAEPSQNALTEFVGRSSLLLLYYFQSTTVGGLFLSFY